MKYLISDLYSEYECIGGECTDTCCGGMDLVVDYNSYKNIIVWGKLKNHGF